MQNPKDGIKRFGAFALLIVVYAINSHAKAYQPEGCTPLYHFLAEKYPSVNHGAPLYSLDPKSMGWTSFNVHQWYVCQKLNSGFTGTAYKAIRVDVDNYQIYRYALKISPPHRRDAFVEEFDIYSKIRKLPHIAALYEVIGSEISKDSLFMSVGDLDYTSLLSPHIDGEKLSRKRVIQVIINTLKASTTLILHGVYQTEFEAIAFDSQNQIKYLPSFSIILTGEQRGDSTVCCLDPLYNGLTRFINQSALFQHEKQYIHKLLEQTFPFEDKYNPSLYWKDYLATVNRTISEIEEFYFLPKSDPLKFK